MLERNHPFVGQMEEGTPVRLKSTSVTKSWRTTMNFHRFLDWLRSTLFLTSHAQTTNSTVNHQTIFKRYVDIPNPLQLVLDEQSSRKS